MGLADSHTFAATAYIQVKEGDGAIIAYASTVDNSSGDATTLPPPESIPSGDLGYLSGGPGGHVGGQP